ncbi:CHAT domain-containing protein [Microseira wollei]|nr:CHAT domain-containing protein [Microseira wollei]
MARFYHKMLEEKLPPAAALRAAQISMWQEKRQAYSWVAFILQGE